MMNSNHAVLSPSSAHRWTRCPGSVVLAQRVSPASSAYAEEGTLAHRYAAQWLETRIQPDGIPEDMAGYLKDYVDDILAARPGALYVEYPMRIDAITGEDGAVGTVDVVALLHDRILIADLKYGRGVKVYAADNLQLQIYAYAALYEFGLFGYDWIETRIIQPRLNHYDSVSYHAENLVNRIVYPIRQAAKRCFEALKATDLSSYLSPGGMQCRFCPALAICPSASEMMHQAIGAEFEDLDARSDTEAEIIGRNLEIVDLAEAWCKAVRARALEYVHAGGDIPGWALAEGRKGARKWEDESIAREQLINVLGDRAFEKMLISPTKAEKFLKNTPPWETLKELIIQEPGKPTLKRMEG